MASPADTVRCFVAVELPDPVKAACAAAVELLGPGVRGIRWVKPEAMHLTLQFFGNVDRAALPALSEQLQQGAAAHPAFTLRTGPLGQFGGLRRPRTFWLGVEGEVEALQAVQRGVAEAAGRFGIPLEDRPYHPHLTLGRARNKPAPVDPAWWAELAAPGPVEWRVESVRFLESRLGRDGPTYFTIALCSLVI